jgi:hypothetical protein
VNTLSEKECIKADKNYKNQLLILKPEMLSEQYRTPENQYFYATSGFGCDPKNGNKKVFGQFLSDGEKTYFNRGDFLGVADRNQFPEWAKERLSQIEMPKMKILVVENGKAPYEAEIGQDIHEMQSIVGGSIEPIYFEKKGDAIVWCNDEFLLNGSQPNRMVGDCLVRGTFFVSGNYQNEYGEWDSCSLTDEQIQRYSAMFAEPLIAFKCVDLSETVDPEISM